MYAQDFNNTNDWQTYQNALNNAQQVYTNNINSGTASSAATQNAYITLVDATENSSKYSATSHNPLYPALTGSNNSSNGSGNTNTGTTTHSAAYNQLNSFIQTATSYYNSNPNTSTAAKTALGNEINTANSVLGSTSSTDTDYTREYNNLLTAYQYAGGNYYNNSYYDYYTMDQLQSLYDSATNTINSNDWWEYTSASWSALQTAYTAAYQVIHSNTPTGYDIYVAYTDLNTALTNLTKSNTNDSLTQLGNLHDLSSQLDQKEFTTTSWATFQTAYKAAGDILASDNGWDASIAEIQTAYTNLSNAIAGLQPTGTTYTQKTVLNDLYNDVSGYTQGDENGTVWGAFVTALANAKTVLNNSKATVLDYLNAYNALDTANNNLTDKTDKSYIATANYSDVNGVGQVFFTGSKGIPLLTKPEGKAAEDSNGNPVFLANGTQWKVWRQAVLDDGSTWYEVGTNQWVRSTYLMIVDTSHVGQIEYLPDMSVNLWELQPDGMHFTGRRLDDGTQWKMFGSLMVGGRQYFNLGANQWVDAEYISFVGQADTDSANGTSTQSGQQASQQQSQNTGTNA